MTLHYLLAGLVILMMSSLLVYLFYLYSSKERSDRIERGGMIPFTDEPVEKNDP